MTTAESLSRRIIAPDFTPGFFRGMSSDQYHASPGLSCSMLKKAAPFPSSMLRAIQREERDREEAEKAAEKSGEVLPPREESVEHFLVGSLVHQMILEPEKPLPGIVVQPETYPDEKGSAKKWTYAATYCKTWRNNQRRAGLMVVTQDTLDTITGCVDAIAGHPTASRYLRRGHSELSIYRRYEAPAGEIMLRSRLDHVPEGNSLVDIKTVAQAGDAEPSRFRDIAERLGYDMQAAMYLDAWNTLPEECRPDGWETKTCFVFIVVEKVWPFLVSLVYLEPASIEIGRREYLDRANAIAEACHTGRWPDYPEQPVGVQPSKWRQHNAREDWA